MGQGFDYPTPYHIEYQGLMTFIVVSSFFVSNPYFSHLKIIIYIKMRNILQIHINYVSQDLSY